MELHDLAVVESNIIYARPLRPTTNPRIISLAEDNVPTIQTAFRLGETEFNLINIHTLPPVSSSYKETRDKQLAAVAEIANKWENPGIIVGDLNTTPWSPCYRTFKKETGYINTNSGFGLCGTWPGSFPLIRLPLDHIFVHPTIQVVEYKVGPDIGSDHHPVLVDLFLSNGKNI